MPGVAGNTPADVDKPLHKVHYCSMSWFKRAPKPPNDWELRVETLERRFKGLEADWDEWYDKYRRLYARLSKRIQDSKKADEDAPEDTNGQPVGYRNPLAERLLRGGRSGGLLHDR